MRALLFALRMRFGLCWKTWHPFDTETLLDIISAVVAVLCLLLTYGLVQAHEDAVEAEIRAKAAHRAASAAERTLLDCLNGTFRAITADQKFAVVCDRYEIKL